MRQVRISSQNQLGARLWHPAQLLWDLDRFGFSPAKLAHRFVLPHPIALRAVFCVSVPKSGTHLLERVLCLHPQFFRPLLPKLMPYNIERHGGWPLRSERLKPGQVLVTHAPYSPQLAAILGETTAAVLLMVRDPRDVIVSQARYVVQNAWHPYHAALNGTGLEAGIRFALDHIIPDLGVSFLNYLGRFPQWADQPGVLTVRYEDLASSDFAMRSVGIKSIFRHVGVELNAAQVADIATRVISPLSPTFNSSPKKPWAQTLSRDDLARIGETLRASYTRFGYDL